MVVHLFCAFPLGVVTYILGIGSLLPKSKYNKIEKILAIVGLLLGTPSLIYFIVVIYNL